jgi:hypothetical protein
MTVAGTINPNYYYYVIFNNADDATGATGPDPVIAPPWGNGFCAGAATQFMLYNQANPGDGYLGYAFTPGTNLQQYTAIGPPVQDVPPAGGSTIQFEIPLSELATSAMPAGHTGPIQINMINTDVVPVNPNSTAPKTFDALGNTLPGSGQLNDYVTIQTGTAATYNNTSDPIEPEGDVVVTNGSGGYSQTNNPNLDIVGWSVQVTN